MLIGTIERFTNFSGKLSLAAFLLIALSITFTAYVWSEEQIDLANENRFQSFLLADELRQSSDDLTRMVRTYVVTGNPEYKRYFQKILDIRNGVTPRPQDYNRIYWDLVVAGGQAPCADDAESISLIELMKRTGFSKSELDKLAEAKTRSDALTTTENAAMSLVESDGPDVQLRRLQAIAMLHDAHYHAAKAEIMKPIDEVFVLVEQRTHETVHQAEREAFRLRLVLVVLGLALLFLLWRLYADLRKTLGGSLAEVHERIACLGKGDFSAPSVSTIAAEGSILAWLAATRENLRNQNRGREEAINALRNAEERWKFALEGSGNGVWDWDIQAGTVHCSNLLKEMLGYAENEIGDSVDEWERCIHPQDHSQVLADLNAYLNGWTTEYVNEHRQLCKNGGWKWMLDRGMVVARAPDGKPVRMIGTHYDITQRKLQENALRENEERFSQLFKRHDAVMLLTEPNTGAIIDCNPAAERFYGYPQGELCQMRVQDINTLSAEEINAERHNAHANTRNYFIFRHTLANGEKRYVEVYSSPIQAGERSTLLFSIIHDITERRQAEEALRMLNAELENRVAEEIAKSREKDHLIIQQSRLVAMGEITKNISHQWRQPINALNILLANIRDAFHFNELTPEFLDEEVNAGSRIIQRMSDDIDDLRKLFRMDNLMQAFSLKDAISAVLNLTKASLQARQIAVRTDEVFDVQAWGSSSQCSQVLLNLLTNATEVFEERQIPQPSLEIRCGKDDDSAYVLILDNGGGIPEEVLPKIFDPYFSTRPNSKGIGLYMAKMLMQQMNGVIQARNVDGGAEFRLSLPLSAQEVGASETGEHSTFL